MKTKYILIAIVAALVAWCQTQAQTEKKPLTNQDIVQMVKAGLAESVIVAAIQSSPAGYDNSPAALIELQKAAVPAKVQEAMLTAAKPANAAPAVTLPGQPALTMGSLNRVFLQQGQERIEMKQNKGEFDTVAAPFFAKVFIKFEGRQAEFRCPSSTPVFEVTLPGNWVASEHVKLVKPDVKNERRELTVQGMAGPGVPIKPDKKANLPLVFEELRKTDSMGVQVTSHQVKPAKALPTGEYVLTIDSTYYCFGVDADK